MLVEDHHLIEKLSHFDRERIPERVVYAKGSDAYGYFEVLVDVTRWTKARFLAPVGKPTEIFIRFPTVPGDKGSTGTVRDPRGFGGALQKGRSRVWRLRLQGCDKAPDVTLSGLGRTQVSSRKTGRTDWDV